MSLIEQLKTDFRNYITQAEGERSSSFVQLREKSFEEFEKLGFPTIKHEEWKYTNLKPVTDKVFTSTCAPSEIAEKLFKESMLYAIKANRLVFVNGCFDAKLSSIIEKDPVILISTLTTARK